MEENTSANGKTESNTAKENTFVPTEFAKREHGKKEKDYVGITNYIIIFVYKLT